MDEATPVKQTIDDPWDDPSQFVAAKKNMKIHHGFWKIPQPDGSFWQIMSDPWGFSPLDPSVLHQIAGSDTFLVAWTSHCSRAG